MTHDGAQIVELIAKVCVTRGFTKVQLAKELGVTPTTVYRWSRGDGKFPPSNEKVKALRDLLGTMVSPDLYRKVGQLVKERGMVSLADLREVLGKRCNEGNLRVVLYALANDGVLDFAARL